MMWTTLPRSEREGLAYVEAGCGKPLLFLHGVGLKAEAWNAQVEVFKHTNRVFAPDMPGHGESERLGGKTSLEDYTKKLSILIDEPATIVGHSMGAMIALDMAICFPEYVKGIIAVNPVFRRSDDAARAVQARAAEITTNFPPDPSNPLNRWFGNNECDEKEACRDWLTHVNPGGYKDAYMVFATEDGPCEGELKSIACPSLFITGANDPNSTPAMSEAMANLAQKGTSMIVDAAAHMLPMTHAKELNKSILEFLPNCV